MFIGAEAMGRIEARLWPRWRAAIEHVESVWRRPDDGIWEARGPQRHYTYSKVMAWVVFDRAVRLAERYGLEAPLERWKQVRDEIHREVCEQGYDRERRTFTQYYGSKELDASVLNIPLVGFLPGTDERVTGTIDAVRRELGRDGFVSRYSTAETDDGLPGDEGQFLACSFWLVSALARNGRTDEARALFERLAGLANDLGLLAEEYDVERRRQVGNFPQAFSHLTLIIAARDISAAEAARRSGCVSARIGRPPSRAQIPGPARARPVHLQLRGLEHERDDQRHHARTWTRRSQGVQATITLFLLIMAILMIPCSKLTDRWGRKRCFTVGLVLYGIGALLSAVVPRARRADPRQLGPRGRRHGAADPARLHPHHAAVRRPHLARAGVRRDQRAGRHRRRGGTADRRSHHHRRSAGGPRSSSRPRSSR